MSRGAYQTILYGTIDNNDKYKSVIVKEHAKLISTEITYDSHLETTENFEIILKHFKPSEEEYNKIVKAVKDHPECNWYFTNGYFSTYSGTLQAQITGEWRLVHYKVTGEEYAKVKDYIEYEKLVQIYQQNGWVRSFDSKLENIDNKKAKILIQELTKDIAFFNSFIKIIETNKKLIEILEKI